MNNIINQSNEQTNEKEKTMNNLKVVAGLDIGNGYVKGKAVVFEKSEKVVDTKTPIIIDMPSTVAYTNGSDIPVEPTDGYIKNIFNELDVNISSRSIKTKDEGRLFLGTRGIKAGSSQTEFNIDNHTPKCLDGLSMQLVLGSTAGLALRHYWETNGHLPEKLFVNGVAALALPIEDYMEYKDVYAKMLENETHFVHIHNFAKDIPVEIHFQKVVVVPEGAAGQYAITKLGAKFLQMALDMARASGANIDPSYTGEMLASAQNTIGVDIGEGNVNFPVFSEGKISVESSSSINKGYGTVLNEVVSDLRNTRYSYESRKDLADFMLKTDLLPAQKFVRGQTEKAINKQVPIFVRDLLKEYTNVFRKVGLRTDVIYVYGGGAGPIRETLYPLLVEASALDENYSLPVIYMDSSYSRDLNRNGLFIAASLAAQVETNF